MRKALPLLALLSLLAQPARASDFSDLARPDFARALLMTQQQREEMACAEGWIATGIDRPLAPLIAAMDDRHAIALGSRRFTEKRFPMTEELDVMQVELGAPNDPPAPSLEDEKKRRLAELPSRCAALAAAFAKGGLAAVTPMLAPRPGGPIALPPTGECLRQLESGRLAEADETMASSIRDLRRQLAASRLVTAAEKAAIEADYARATSAGAAPTKVEGDELSGPELKDLVCFPVMAELARRLAGQQ